jgi:dihydrofolate reductase
MIISTIVATAKNNVIGSKNSIPWYLSGDFKNFARLTKGHSVIMGKNTYQSIIDRLGHPLPERKNIVLAQASENLIAEGCFVASSFEEALSLAEGDEVFIIGGAQVYKHTFPYIQKMYITLVDAYVEGDAFFPEYNLNDWNLISIESHTKDEKNNYDYKFLVYERKK